MTPALFGLGLAVIAIAVIAGAMYLARIITFRTATDALLPAVGWGTVVAFHRDDWSLLGVVALLTGALLGLSYWAALKGSDGYRP